MLHSKHRCICSAVLAATISLSSPGKAANVSGAETDGGWTSGLDLTVEGATSVSGGAQHGTAVHGMALGHVEWQQPENADRSLRFRGYASALSLIGRGPSERFIGDFLAASNMEGYASTRLYSWWFEAQKDEWSLRAGALLADEEFVGTDTGGNFLNASFGWPVFISANTINTGPAFFVAAPGVRLARSFGESASWRLGVYDGDSFDSLAGDPSVTRHGLHYRLGGAQGLFVISEAECAAADGANVFKAGAWLHTAEFADARDDIDGQPIAVTGEEARSHGGNFGVFASFERTLVGKPGEAGHVAAFVRAGFSPADRNAISWAFDTGVACTGLFPGRAADVTALGLAHAHFSSRFADNARASDPASPSPDFEQVLELTHSVALSERFTLQPDLQFIRHPGGSTAQPDALAFLFRLGASF